MAEKLVTLILWQKNIIL